MNKEAGYVLQGFLLLVVVAAAVGMINVIASIKPQERPVAVIEETTSSDSNPRNSPGNSTGKAIFQDNCARCHSLTKDITGPALKGVKSRVTDNKLLHDWVRNPAAVIKSGNPYFNNLKDKFGGIMMSSFPELTDAEIDAVLDYVEH